MSGPSRQKALGQNFLCSPEVTNAIVERALELANSTGCRSLLEIGPGKGALTEQLIIRKPAGIEKIILAERDVLLAERWVREKTGFTEVLVGDFVREPEHTWLITPPCGVISNLPYSAATAMILKLSAFPAQIPFMVLMFQQEVAHRLRAHTGEKAWGSLSLLIQNFWNVEKFLSVPARMFRPAPKVNSEVVILTPREIPHVMIPPEGKETWEKLLKVSFMHRRKTLRSSLGKLERWGPALRKSGIDSSKRAEALNWPEWNAFFRAVIPLLLLALLSWAFPARANIGDAFGFGAKSAALGGQSAALPGSGFAAYTNPATLSTDQTKPDISYGWAYMKPKFFTIDDVVIQNSTTSDQLARGPVDTGYNSTLGQLLGFRLNLFPSLHNLSLGFAMYFPFSPLAHIDSGEAYIPEYVLYRARTHKPEINAGMAFYIVPGLNFGVGVKMGYDLQGSGAAFIQTDQSKPSRLRFSEDLSPKYTPIGGLYYRSLNPEQTAHQSSGFVIRFPLRSESKLLFNYGTRALGNLAALDFNANVISAMVYDPLTLEWGTSWKLRPWLKTLFQLEFQRWSQYKPPAYEIVSPETKTCSGAPCGILISPSYNPMFKFQDIWIPRLGLEIPIQKMTYRLGYYYRPSILGTVPTHQGNYIDPPKHAFSGGAGFQFTSFLGIEGPCSLDGYLIYQRFKTGEAIKEEATMIGAPGYRTGGYLYGGGASLSIGI